MNDICTMRFFRALIIIATLFATCCESKHDYDPSDSLTAREKDAILTSIIRYFAKRPEAATETDKFDPKYDQYYQEKIKETRFEKYYATEEYYYFMVTQIAPSL